MSQRTDAVPEGLTRGYSNTFTDMLVRHPVTETPVLTSAELAALDLVPTRDAAIAKELTQ